MVAGPSRLSCTVGAGSLLAASPNFVNYCLGVAIDFSLLNYLLYTSMFSDDIQGFLFSLLLTGNRHVPQSSHRVGVGHCEAIPKIARVLGDYLEYLSPREDSRLSWLKLKHGAQV